MRSCVYSWGFVPRASHVLHVGPGIHHRVRARPALAAELEHPIAQAAEERPIVGHEDHRALELVKRLDEHVLRREIEMVGRLVEHEEVRRIEQHPREHQPRALTAGE